MFLMALGLLSGAMVLVQSPVNTKLRDYVGSPALASFVSFLTGTVFLATACVLTGEGLSFTAEGGEPVPWWAYTGGFFGTGVVFSFILLFPRLGAVNTVVMPLTGMVVAGALIDRFGLFGNDVYYISAAGALGFLVLIAGMAVTVSRPSDGGAKTSGGPGRNLTWYALGVSVGALMASQTAINGTLGTHLGSALQSALTSFAVGTAVLFLACLWKRNLPDMALAHKGRAPWWVYAGGILGALYVFINAYLVPEMGTGMTAVLTVTGQMIGGAVVDNFGLLGTEKRVMNARRFAGLALMLVGVALVKMF